MQRDVRLFTHHPTVMTWRPGWNVKEQAGAELMNRTVFHRSRGTAGEHQPYMLNVTPRRGHARPHVNRPLPSRLIGSAPDGHPPDANQFEFSFFERPHFIRLFKTL